MKRESFSDWLDRHAGRVFLFPAILLVLAFSIFPLIISAWLAVSRFQISSNGYDITFIGWLNFKKLIFGSQQFHLVGTFAPVPILGWLILATVSGLVLWAVWRYFRSGAVTVVGLLGRLISFGLAILLALMFTFTIGDKAQIGSLSTTLLYVIVGVSLQFLIGTALAWLCAQRIKGRDFFRVVFFVPMMVTPVGVAYMFRMLADMKQGPFSPIWRGLGLGEFSWATNSWTAKSMVIIGDTWQWVPFIFIVMLAAFESQPRDEIEAAELDGASPLQIFRDITWPSVAPVAATIVLIRVIEAFKIIDLPNVLTNGGPGIATESLTLHSFIDWRTLNLGSSAAVAYILLFVSTVACVSFFNFVVEPMRRSRS
jgi:multiple sugar transport system permease protein